MTIFLEIAAALVLASLCGIIAYLLRQPTIVGFIFAGLIIGYFGGLKEGHLDIVNGLSSVGVALLLFIVGLEMNFRELKAVGFPAVVVGLGQIVFGFLFGFWLLKFLGFDPIVATYLSIAFAFSSTAIMVRLLSEKKDLKSLYGKIVLGYLLFQDLIAIMISIFLAGLAHDTSHGVALTLFLTLIKGAFFVALTVVLSKYLPKLLDYIGAAPDLLYLFSMAWAVGMGALFASPWVGLSIEAGGFLAGLALANSSEHFQISAKLKPLRDFFLIILFMGFGARLITSEGSLDFSHVAILSLLVLVVNPLIVFLIMSVLRYRSRTAFFASLATAQISEFSFIIMILGEEIGHVSHEDMRLLAAVAITSIVASSYAIIYNNKVYAFLKPVLKLFEFKKNLIEEKGEETYLENHIVLAGVHRMGQNILRSLTSSEEDFVAVDFDPRIIESLRRSGLPALYGDISDPEIQELVSLDKAKLLISTVPDFRDNISILQFMRRHNSKGKVILTAESEHEAEDLYELGADYVLLPHFIGGLEVADMIVKDKDLIGLDALKKRDFSLIRRSI